MRKTSRVVTIILLCTMLIAMPVSAKEDLTKENPTWEPEISVSTDKSVYSKNENITETVTITSPEECSLKGVEIRVQIPENYITENGKEAPEEWVSAVPNIAAGATSETKVVFYGKNAGQNGGQSTDKDKKDMHNTSAGNKGTPGTGDSSNMAIWICLIVVSTAVIIMLIKKKKGRKIFAILLSVITAGAIVQNGGLYVKAAEHGNEKSVTVSKDITVENKKTALTVKVTYKTEPAENPGKGEDKLSYEGYELKWQDEFNGTALNREDWNVELHDPGWVNAEWQEYVDSEENIYLKDGKLVLRPIRNVDQNGNATYTSGRINTQNKQNFKYGIFEARVKVPEGKGYLPAFWLMAADENQYGQWPRCGEIDIMEVHGSNTTKSYGTIHYGNPHKESQGTMTLSEGSFSEEYHTFAVEWLPGKITWYVDGTPIHTESDWYSRTEGQGEITYPAPFDQEFYVILNLAVGGSWVGYPDETTDFENAAYEVDYVRVYQKDSYDENVTKPDKEVILRDPDENGNYVINGDFAEAEDLTDDEDWKFLTALEGDAEAKIADQKITICTTNSGTVDYSVQLVQPNLPMKKGGTYELSFDAWADEARTMKVGLTAPDNGYVRYMADTSVDLTTKRQTYTYEFTMTQEDDANGRLEFNLGNAGSIADVSITNVTLKKISQVDISEEEKTVLADGNHVYNGSFQEGTGHLGYWDIKSEHAVIGVTDLKDGRRLKVVAAEGTTAENPIIISQSGLALSADTGYALSFTAQGDAGTKVQAAAAGNTFTAGLSGENTAYNYKFEQKNGENDIVFTISEPGTYYLDKVRIVEDTLIKNGSFNAGLAGYEAYIDGSADASCVVDSLTEDNAVDFTISNTGDQAWKIQLKQNNVELEKDQWYRLTLDAKSSIARKLMFAIQRDGSSDDDWTPYSGEKIVDLTNDYQTYDIEFQMKNETDLKSILSISMGAVGGTQITTRHRICIDNISLEKIEAPEIEEKPIGENMLMNPDFSSGIEGWESAVTAPGEAAATFENNKAVYNITNVGTADWNVQLKQSSITLEQGSRYKVAFKAHSTESRTIKLAMLTAAYDWYGGADIELKAGEEQEVTCEFVVDKTTDNDITMVISMGIIDGVETPLSTISLSDFSLVKLS
ncbi:carbohydrate binding domain-containing protein [Roseburia hominis]